MQFGELLISANLITRVHLHDALIRQRDFGGRLGDNLVAIGAISSEQLERFLHQVPPEPLSFEATGSSSTELMTLLIKLIYSLNLETVQQFVDEIKLPPPLVDELIQLAVGRSLLAAMGSVGLSTRYELGEKGRLWAQDALKKSLYIGPAPVTLDDFCKRIDLQKITNEKVSFEQVAAALKTYSVTDGLIHKIGPALNSGRAMLLYGPPGNGKTSIASSFVDIFSDIVYIPYAVAIDGIIMKVFDPSWHHKVTTDASSQKNALGGIRRHQYDARWVAVRRPFIVTGGELTLEMLDLRFDPATGYYEAPLHIKALGGCFVIDDFGRQMVSPTALLNRWIVPMESRLDYLKLHTGKSFSIPFEAMLVFSTNLHPEDLMDAAFLRRLPYKIEIGAPSLENYINILMKECSKSGISVSHDTLQSIVYKVKVEKGLELAAFQPKFIVDQVVAIATFLKRAPEIDNFAIDYALSNLKISV